MPLAPRHLSRGESSFAPPASVWLSQAKRSASPGESVRNWTRLIRKQGDSPSGNRWEAALLGAGMRTSGPRSCCSRIFDSRSWARRCSCSALVCGAGWAKTVQVMTAVAKPAHSVCRLDVGFADFEVRACTAPGDTPQSSCGLANHASLDTFWNSPFQTKAKFIVGDGRMGNCPWQWRPLSMLTGLATNNCQDRD